MNIEEAKEYLNTTEIEKADLELVKEACYLLKEDSKFLIRFPLHLGFYFKHIDYDALHNVLLYETKKPIDIYNKLRLIGCLSFSGPSMNSYLDNVLGDEKSVAIVLSKKEFDSISHMFNFVPSDFYFGYCMNSRKYIVYLIKK